MPRLDDARVDWSNGNLEDPFAFNLSERVLPLATFQDSVPSKVFFEWVGAFGPVFVPDEPTHVWMADRDQSEHVADFPLEPLGRMDMGSNRCEQTIITVDVRAKQ